MPRIVTYCRFATPMPTERIAGIERQLAALVASLPEHALIGAFHDQGVSGLSLPDDRPGFQALLSAQAREPAEILLLPALHHLTRDREVVLDQLATLTTQGLTVRTSEDLVTWPAPTLRDLLSTSHLSLGA